MNVCIISLLSQNECMIRSDHCTASSHALIITYDREISFSMLLATFYVEMLWHFFVGALAQMRLMFCQV